MIVTWQLAVIITVILTATKQMTVIVTLTNAMEVTLLFDCDN